MAAKVTLTSRLRRMNDYFSLPFNKYLVIGKKTAWTDDNNPPDPIGNETTIVEIIGAKKVQETWFVKVISNPTEAQKVSAIYYKGLYYSKYATYAEGVAAGCTSIIHRAILDAEDFPIETYRQVGVQVSVDSTIPTFRNNEVGPLWSSLPDNKKGYLEVIDNRKPQTRSADQQEDLIVLVDF